MFVNGQNIQFDDLKNTCRTCMSDGDLKPLQDNVIRELLQLITNINYTKDDEFSQQICQSCFENLNKIQAFVLQCKNTDITLKSRLTNFKNNRKSFNLVLEYNNDETEPIVIRDVTDLTLKNCLITSQNNFSKLSNNERSSDLEIDYDRVVIEPILIKEEIKSEGDLTIDEDFKIPFSSDICPDLLNKKLDFSPKETDGFKGFSRHSEIYDENLNIDVSSAHLNYQSYIPTNGINDGISSTENLRKKDISSNERIHSDKRLYECKICYNSYKETIDSIIQKTTSHLPLMTPYDCQGRVYKICNQAFNSVQKLVAHKKMHTDEKEKAYECDVCLKTFSEQYYLISHLKTHENKHEYKCDVCNKAFNHKGSLTRHTKIHLSKNLFKCNVCFKKFNVLQNFKRHLRTHTRDRAYQCETCNKVFREIGHLRRHERIHSGEKRHKCEVCLKQFADKSNLMQHKKLHEGIRPYKCDVCEKTFLLQSILTKHKRIHSSERPYTCEVCFKDFKQSNTLSAHKVLHTTGAPLKCTICNKTFQILKYLNRHKKLHSMSNEKKELI